MNWGDWKLPGACGAWRGGVSIGACCFFCDMESRFIRSCMTSFPLFVCVISFNWGTLEGSVTERCPPGDWKGG